MQRKDAERLARLLDALSGDCAHTDGGEDGGATCTEAATALRALLAERDAAFAAGQEDMRERAAAEISDWDLASMSGINDPEDEVTDYVVSALRALSIKPRPE